MPDLKPDEAAAKAAYEEWHKAFPGPAAWELQRATLRARWIRVAKAAADAATLAANKRAADIALAIDSGRGNEKEIAKAILEGT